MDYVTRKVSRLIAVNTLKNYFLQIILITTYDSQPLFKNLNMLKLPELYIMKIL